MQYYTEQLLYGVHPTEVFELSHGIFLILKLSVLVVLPRYWINIQIESIVLKVEYQLSRKYMVLQWD